MAPTKRKKRNILTSEIPDKPKVKRITKAIIEKSICKRKLDALDQEESKNLEDRFNFHEKKALLEAYNERGFTVFQDMQVLQPYLPNRSLADLKGLIQRLEVQSSSLNQEQESKSISHIDGWQSLCQNLLNSHVKDRKINIEHSIPEALTSIANDLKTQPQNCDTEGAVDYSTLVESFSQLVSGKFPDNMTPSEAKISGSLFDHICAMADSIDVKILESRMKDGCWLEESQVRREKRLELARKGLNRIDGKTKKCPTLRDMERDKSMEALCLELPKIKRVTDMLNPLSIDESFVGSLMEYLGVSGCKSQELTTMAMSGDFKFQGKIK